MYRNLIWHDSIFSPPENRKIYESLHEALSEVVSKWSDSPAVISEEKIYTFSDLASRVAGLSAEINECGHHIGPIALLQKVGLDTIASWFACSLSGRPFLLLEPDNPPSRLIELIKLSGCTTALVDDSTSHILKELKEVVQIVSGGRYGTFIQGKGQHAEDPAMIFPTSGSTGNPKLITYASTTIQVKVQSSILLMGIPEKSRVMIAGSHSNYGFLHHALVFLLSGNAVSLADVKASGFDSILDTINNLGVRHVRFTPSLFRKLAVLPKAQKALNLLDAVRFSGEPLLENDVKLAKSVLNPDCQIQNVYGSTESSLFIWKNTDDNSHNTNLSVPIGRIYPLSSYAIRPLDDSEKDSGKGELMIRSKFHALGDFKGGVIDKERFPLSEESSEERIYATGDIVHQLDDGNIMHIGRLGRMVKIRGNRVYLTEVEQQLRSVPGVAEAVVVDCVENENLVIYGFVTKESVTINSEDIRSKLSSKLPNFMIPKSIIILEQIPLMAGGKVDFQMLTKLISSSDSIGQLKNQEDDYQLLIHLWDSLLWKGAHNQNADFFSLGGDSLGFMILLDKIEQNFKKTLSAKDIKNKCTLKNIASSLGVEISALQEIIKYKSLQVNLMFPTTGFSKGVALAMPGVGGPSVAYPFYQAGFFRDYDIWAIEFPINTGDLLKANRWRIAACEIVQGIKDGIIPAPDVVFGFSFGGGLAWLVGRLLSGSLYKPQYVVMLDAPPLHKRSRLRNQSLKRALAAVSNEKSPQVLHIHRYTPGKTNFISGDYKEWNKSDKFIKVVELPVVNHSDMINCEVLALAYDAVRAFLNNEEINFKWSLELPPPNLLSSHIVYALNGSDVSLQIVRNQLKKGTEKLEGYLIDLAILMYSVNDKKLSEEFIQTALKKWPDSGIVHFLNNRMRHKANMLFFGDLPKIYPSTLGQIDYRLTLLLKNVRPKLRSVRLIYLTFDVISATLKSRFVRLRNINKFNTDNIESGRLSD